MRPGWSYLLLCVLRTLLPYSQFVPWVIDHGLDMRLFVRDLFANRIGGFFGASETGTRIVLNYSRPRFTSYSRPRFTSRAVGH
jgi:hypothetical protein